MKVVDFWVNGLAYSESLTPCVIAYNSRRTHSRPITDTSRRTVTSTATRADDGRVTRTSARMADGREIIYFDETPTRRGFSSISGISRR